MALSEIEKDDLVKYRLDRAYETLDYVKENKIEKSQGDLFKHLFRLRQTGDYDAWVYLEEEDVAPLVEPAQKFIEEIEKLIINIQYSIINIQSK